MSRRPSPRPALGCLALACAVAGCGTNGMFPVSGTVKLDGEPLAAGSVTFHPDDTRGTRTSHVPAGIISNGTYEVYTSGVRGAPPGFYKVTVTADDFSGGKAPPKTATAVMPKSLIAAKYGARGTTPLAVEVSAAPAAGAYDLAVTRK